MQSVIDRFPRFSAVIGAERACGRDRHVDSFRILRIEKNRMRTHAARARLPIRAGIVFSETRTIPSRIYRRPSIQTALRPRHRRKHARDHAVTAPDANALELPGMLVPSYH